MIRPEDPFGLMAGHSQKAMRIENMYSKKFYEITSNTLREKNIVLQLSTETDKTIKHNKQ